jgi:hypothetical protein
MELIKRGDDRIDIKKKQDTNPDRGYIWKVMSSLKYVVLYEPLERQS